MHPERAPRSWRRREALACALAASASLSPLEARANELVELRWSSPPDCPQVDAVRERIRTIVNRSERVAPKLRAEGEIARVGGKYRLTLRVHDGEARRERIIESDSCAALAGAAAVALGLLLRTGPSDADSAPPGGSGDADGSPISAASNRKATASGATVDPTRASREKSGGKREASPESEAGRELRFVLRAPLGALDAGLLPDAALGVGAGVGLRYGPWHAGASVRFSSAQTLIATNPSNVDVAVDVERIAMDVWACGAWSSGPFELGPCLTLGVDRFSARGTGPRVEENPQHFVALAPGAGVQAHFRATDWFACFVTASAGLETSRARLTVGGGVGEVEELGAARITAGLGTEWIF